MIVTDAFVGLAIVFVKGRSWSLALAYLVVFGFIDACLWGASLHKVRHFLRVASRSRPHFYQS